MGFSGDRLRAHRQRAELTQQALADTVGVFRQSVNAWERGGPTDELETVRAMVDACFDSTDYAEGRKAFAEKRTPDFQGV